MSAIRRVFSVFTPLPSTRSVYVPDKTRSRSILTAEKKTVLSVHPVWFVILDYRFLFCIFITNPRMCVRYYCVRFANTVKKSPPPSAYHRIWSEISLFDGTPCARTPIVGVCILIDRTAWGLLEHTINRLRAISNYPRFTVYSRSKTTTVSRVAR